MTFWIMLPLGIVVVIFFLLLKGMAEHMQEAYRLEERDKRNERSGRRY
jgi:hypothetical protein